MESAQENRDAKGQGKEAGERKKRSAYSKDQQLFSFGGCGVLFLVFSYKVLNDGWQPEKMPSLVTSLTRSNTANNEKEGIKKSQQSTNGSFVPSNIISSFSSPPNIDQTLRPAQIFPKTKKNTHTYSNTTVHC